MDDQKPQKPSVGRIVHVKGEHGCYAAMVLFVDEASGRCNLVVWDAYGKQTIALSNDEWHWPERV